MPTTIAELLQDKAKPVTARETERLDAALARMIEHDYSQLPVVDDGGKPTAMLSMDSIARSLNGFGAAPKALRVLDAMDERIEICMVDDELLDVLGRLRQASALLVADEHEKLVGIITSHDTTEYFRLRAQDIMWVQDVEETIKQFVLAAFGGDDSRDEAALMAAIEEITPSPNSELYKPYRKSLQRYLELEPPNGQPPKLADKHARTAFDEHFSANKKVKPFEELTLGQYIELLLHESRWKRYQPVFLMDREPIKRLLLSALDTRNDLAHFRTDISEQRRAELRQCRDWLTRHEDAVTAAFTVEKPKPEEQTTEGTASNVSPPKRADAPPLAFPDFTNIFEGTRPERKPDAVPVSVPEDGASPVESRYTALATWLSNRPADEDQVSLSFAAIEAIIKGRLPASAREHRAWWGNNPKGHTQSRQWVDVGWDVTSVSMRGERVTFARSRREKYGKFFSALRDDLKRAGDKSSPYSFSSPEQHFLAIGRLPGTKSAQLAFSFTRNRQFRIELYLDAGEQGPTKQLFDAFYGRKNLIEGDLGEALAWERLDDKRASRIALYYPVSIMDDDDQLLELRKKAVPAMLQFREVLRKHLGEALLAGQVPVEAPPSVNGMADSQSPLTDSPA